MKTHLILNNTLELYSQVWNLKFSTDFKILQFSEMETSFTPACFAVSDIELRHEARYQVTI